MTLMTRAAIIDKYGLRLTMEQVAEVLGVHPGTVYNQIASGTLKIGTYKEGGRRYASYAAVADYLDNMSATATINPERPRQ
jgi:excisionase family DNA binding protein